MLVTGTFNVSVLALAPPQSKEPDMEKIAVSCEGPSLDARVDPRFGRAAGFLVVDPKTLAFDYFDNGSTQVMSQGAGIQAAEIVANAGATVVLTGFVGPKAFQALSAAKIRVSQNMENLTVRQALDKYNAGDVAVAAEPNRPGHWR